MASPPTRQSFQWDDPLRLEVQLAADERAVRDTARAYAQEQLLPKAQDAFRYEKTDVSLFRSMGEVGLLGATIPEAYGGAGLSYAAYLACAREVSAACAATGSIWATNFHAMKPLIDFGNEEQKQRLLPRVAEGAIGALAITEPSAGSDATGMTTRFTPAGNDTVIVSGGKTCISNGDVADLMLVFGKWSEIESSSKE
ncbi:MAG: acyl-CoA dehydrogenase family protein, partial [Hyphomicrobiales bacterium]|nr:acyl-CoA dehydrogenase family protein [Hyphomicrobiales bacterium]